MNSRILWMVAAAAGLHSTALPAQYSRTLGDTLRYEEVTESRVSTELPGGTVNVQTLHSGVIALTFSGGDNATAWYEGLRLEQHGPGDQHQSPNTRAIHNEPFNLTFDARGRVSTISTPTFPPHIASMTDLTQQFTDFFITIPEGSLSVGREWADTLLSTRAGRTEDTYRAFNIRSYRIVDEREVDGEPAVLISVSQQMELEGSSPLSEPGLKATVRLSGVEEGHALFSPSRGVLLSRQRRGQLGGEFAVLGGPTPARFPQFFEYENSLSLQR